MAGTRSKSTNTKPWNRDLTSAPADEILYTDYTDEAKTSICNYKFKTTPLKLEHWIDIFNDQYEGATWEKEGVSTTTTLMSAKRGTKKLVIRLCKETGIVVVQGALMHQWKESFHEWKALVSVACSTDTGSSISITSNSTDTDPDPAASTTPEGHESEALKALNASIALLEAPLPSELMDSLVTQHARMDAIESSYNELNKTILDLGSPLQESTPARLP